MTEESPLRGFLWWSEKTDLGFRTSDFEKVGALMGAGFFCGDSAQAGQIWIENRSTPTCSQNAQFFICKD